LGVLCVFCFGGGGGGFFFCWGLFVVFGCGGGGWVVLVGGGWLLAGPPCRWLPPTKNPPPPPPPTIPPNKLKQTPPTNPKKRTPTHNPPTNKQKNNPNNPPPKQQIPQTSPPEWMKCVFRCDFLPFFFFCIAIAVSSPLSLNSRLIVSLLLEFFCILSLLQRHRAFELRRLSCLFGTLALVFGAFPEEIPPALAGCPSRKNRLPPLAASLEEVLFSRRMSHHVALSVSIASLDHWRTQCLALPVFLKRKNPVSAHFFKKKGRDVKDFLFQGRSCTIPQIQMHTLCLRTLNFFIRTPFSHRDRILFGEKGGRRCPFHTR